jgi:hypothetical protein
MTNQRPRLIKDVAWCIAAFSSLLIAAQTPVPAQQPGRTGQDRRAEQRTRQQREAMLRTPTLGDASQKLDPKRVEAAINLVKEDFKQIQIVRNEIVRNLLAKKPLDYKLIADRTGEINKRADRLKTYLMPPAPEGKEKNRNNQVELNNNEEFKEALVQLCNQIVYFIDSPVFKNPGTVDVEQSIRAGGDLLSIIEISGNVKRSAEKLNKASKVITNQPL